MAHGIEVWDASTNVIVDTSKMLGHIIGNVLVSSSPSSMTVDGFAYGTPFYFVMGPGSIDAVISISGSTLSWSGPTGYYIFYGTY